MEQSDVKLLKNMALPETMHAIAIGGGRAWLVDQPTPKPHGNEVVVKLGACLICGSNMPSFARADPSINCGHEGAGEVVAVDHSHLLKVGDRVALAPLNACGRCQYCRQGEMILCKNRPPVVGCFSQFTRVADVMCTKLPDEISFAHGALLGCGLGPAYGAMKKLAVNAYDTLVITGLGPVGLGAVALATFLNARVIALDPEPYRQNIARSLGCHTTIDPTSPDAKAQIYKAVGEHGLLKAVECSGNPQAQRMLIDLASPTARLAFIGENHSPLPVYPSEDMIRKHLTITGVWHMNVLDAPDLVTFLLRCPEKADLLLTHRFGFDQVQQAFEIFGSRQTAKVVLTPD